jgi:hypothetical protein
VYYQNGKYNVDAGRAKLGTSELLKAEVLVDRLVLRWSCGRVVEIPRGWFQMTYSPI